MLSFFSKKTHMVEPAEALAGPQPADPDRRRAISSTATR